MEACPHRAKSNKYLLVQAEDRCLIYPKNSWNFLQRKGSLLKKWLNCLVSARRTVERRLSEFGLMRRSNRNFNTPSRPRENPEHLTIFCARGVGNLTGKAFLGVGNLTFAWVGWAKLNRKWLFLFGRRSCYQL